MFNHASQTTTTTTMNNLPPPRWPHIGKWSLVLWAMLFLFPYPDQVKSKPLQKQDDGKPPSALTDAELCSIKNREYNWSDAIAACNKAIQRNPKLAQAWVDRCRAQLNLGKLIDAKADCQEALRLDPVNALGYVRRGDIEARLRYNTAAISDYSKAIDLDPSCIPAFGNRGRLKMAMKDYRGAISDFGKVISLNPKDRHAYNDRGLAKEELRDFTAALADYAQAIALDPKNAIAYFNRGRIYAFHLKDYRAAIADFDHAIAINPQWSFPYNDRGTVKAYFKDYRGAIADYDQSIAVSDYKEISVQLSNRARARQWSGDAQGALLDAQLAAELGAGNGGPHFEYGEILFLQGRRQEACASFRKGSSIQPLNTFIRAELPALNPDYLHYCNDAK
jgi:tetratricopeptide (TPR) repeat protein